MQKILTPREREIIEKKITGASLSQNESNILSKSIRPKLRELKKINPGLLLNKLEYNQKAQSIEAKIKRIVLKNISDVKSVILCGSAIQNNYKEYNDIDLIIATSKLLNKSKKTRLIEKIIEEGRKIGIKLDVQIYKKNSILEQYRYNPSLIYQLKDSKIIYGKLKLPDKISISSLYLKMKLDWSEGLSVNPSGDELYYAIRNAMLVLLLMNRKIDNYKLRENVENALGASLLHKLRNNLASKSEKKLALSYLNLLTNHLEEELKNKKWEKIEIENH